MLHQYGLVRLKLSSNYRSTQRIVNTAVAIIASNGVKAEQRKRKNDEMESGDEAKQPEEQKPSKKPSVTATHTKASSNTLPASARTAVLTHAKQPGLTRPHTTPSLSPHSATGRPPINTNVASALSPSTSMHTSNVLGEQIIEVRTDDWRQEVRCIVDHIRTLTTSSRRRQSEWKEEGGRSTQHTYSYTDIAILVRTNHTLRRIHKELKLANIPVAKQPREDNLTTSQLEDSNSQPDDGPVDGVHVLTVHKAKGLEWAVVFVASFSEGNMPLTGPTTATNDGPIQQMYHVDQSTGEVDDSGSMVDVEEMAAVHDP